MPDERVPNERVAPGRSTTMTLPHATMLLEPGKPSARSSAGEQHPHPALVFASRWDLEFLRAEKTPKLHFWGLFCPQLHGRRTGGVPILLAPPILLGPILLGPRPAILHGRPPFLAANPEPPKHLRPTHPHHAPAPRTGAAHRRRVPALAHPQRHHARAPARAPPRTQHHRARARAPQRTGAHHRARSFVV